jgi:hypothetical protein
VDDHPLAFLAGVLVLGLGWHFFKLRRFRREGYQLVLDELAASLVGGHRPAAPPAP